MKEISCTIKAGHGSEKHNHSIKYRETLEHVKKYEKEDHDEYVMELIEYTKSYEEQINEYMQPYIDDYNKSRDDALKLAKEKYEQGKIKRKPRPSEYKHIEQKWCDLHKDDTYFRHGKEYKTPLNRSLILGIGDKDDRDNNNISKEQALEIFKKQLKGFQESFPNFHVLGATIHLDEDGFYHMHLDFFVAYEKAGDKKIRGPKVSTSFDDAMKKMGYKPEQSIINGRDKVPLYFNAFRNKMYQISDEAYRSQGIYLQYKTSSDPSVSNDLNDWQKKQDMIKEVQHEKNEILEAIDDETKTPEEVAEIIEDKIIEIDNTIDELKNSKRSRIDKNNLLVKYTLLDQIDNLVKGIVAPIKALMTSIADKLDDYDALAQDYQELKERNEILERENKFYKNKSLDEQIKNNSINDLRKENELLKKENENLKWYKNIYKKLIPIIARYRSGEEKLIDRIMNKAQLSEENKQKIISDSKRINDKEPER